MKNTGNIQVFCFLLLMCHWATVGRPGAKPPSTSYVCVCPCLVLAHPSCPVIEVERARPIACSRTRPTLQALKA